MPAPVRHTSAAPGGRTATRAPRPDERPCYANRRPADTVTITLPLPPATNNLFANRSGGMGRIKTRAYRAYCQNAILVGSLQKPCRIVGLADVTIVLPGFRGDTDGRIKALLDAAKQIGVIADDGKAYIRDISILRREVSADVRLTFALATDAGGVSA